MSAQRAYLESLDRQFQIVNGAGRRGKVQNSIQRAFHIDVIGHVMLDEEKVIAPSQVFDVAGGAGDEVVHGDNLVSLSQEAIAQVGAQEARSAGDQHAHSYPSSTIR